MDRDLDVFSNYRTITNKIKKRFLKKPNYAEASEQFGTLTRVLKQQECPQYAGFCCLAKARCENTVGNTIAEAQSLSEAARLFFETEKVNVDVKCAALEEHITEAIHCYNQAVKAHQKEGNTALAALVSLELARNLLDIGKIEGAHQYFFRAAEIQKTYSVVDYVCSLQNAATCKLYMNDYSSALQHLFEISLALESLISTDKECLTYSISQILQNVEITSVFALLLMKSSPMDMKEEHLKVMERYTWENSDNNAILPEDLFFSIQSVVMAAQARDGEILKDLENELYPSLEQIQCDMLHKIVLEYNQ